MQGAGLVPLGEKRNKAQSLALTSCMFTNRHGSLLNRSELC